MEFPIAKPRRKRGFSFPERTFAPVLCALILLRVVLNVQVSDTTGAQ
jgi:hypothetical protein